MSSNIWWIRNILIYKTSTLNKEYFSKVNLSSQFYNLFIVFVTWRVAKTVLNQMIILRQILWRGTLFVVKWWPQSSHLECPDSVNHRSRHSVCTKPTVPRHLQWFLITGDKKYQKFRNKTQSNLFSIQTISKSIQHHLESIYLNSLSILFSFWVNC